MYPKTIVIFYGKKWMQDSIRLTEELSNLLLTNCQKYTIISTFCWYPYLASKITPVVMQLWNLAPLEL